MERLTTGQLHVPMSRRWQRTLCENDALAWAASLEAGSEHALANAIVSEAKARGLILGEMLEMKVHPGLGVEGTVATQQGHQENIRWFSKIHE